MALTPIDIQQKTFGPELRGYNMDEVDDFLDEVVSALKDHDQRVRDAQDRIRALEAELSTRGEDESAISRALVNAQKQVDAMLAEAGVEVERIRGEAQSEVDGLLADRDRERLAHTQEIARMRATVADLKRRVSDLSASVAENLDQVDLMAGEAMTELGPDDVGEVEDEIHGEAEDAEAGGGDEEAPAGAGVAPGIDPPAELPTQDADDEGSGEPNAATDQGSLLSDDSGADPARDSETVDDHQVDDTGDRAEDPAEEDHEDAVEADERDEDGDADEDTVATYEDADDEEALELDEAAAETARRPWERR